MRRKWKNRLGVSTVVGNMLMILITLSLAAILVAWAGTSFGAFTGGTQVFFAQRWQALQERFVVEYVYFISPNTINVFVRNVGVEEIKVVAVYANGTSLSAKQSSPCGIPMTLNVNAVCEFDLTTTWASGTTVYLVVASARGNQASFTARGL